MMYSCSRWFEMYALSSKPHDVLLLCLAIIAAGRRFAETTDL